jgi:hypothetical protein
MGPYGLSSSASMRARDVGAQRTFAAVLVVLELACRAQQVDIRTDRRSYSIAPGDSLAIVRLTVRNRGSHRIYFQTVDGRIDLLAMVRVDAKGRILVGADTAGRERWSLAHESQFNSPPAMGVLPLRSDSVVTNAYSLPRGHYRTLVKFGEVPDRLDEHGVWVANFSIQ